MSTNVQYMWYGIFAAWLIVLIYVLMLNARDRKLRQELGINPPGDIPRKLGGFQCTVIAYDPYIAGSKDPNVTMVSLDELAARADIVLSTASLTDTSRGIISRDFLAKTKPGVLVVNVSRGPIVDEAALKDALESGHVAFAGLDVRSPEPPDPKNDLLTKQKNIILTQHIAASSEESLAGLHVEAGQQIIKILEGAGRLPKA